MDFNLLNSLMLAGTIQGFVFGVTILFSRKYKALSTSFLIALILILSYNNLQYYLVEIGLISLTTMYQSIYLPMGILIPPTFYLYTITFLNPDAKIKNKVKLMYLPFLLIFTISIVYKILSLFKVKIVDYYEFVNAPILLHEVLTLVFMLTVLAVLIKRILNFKAQAKSINYKKIIPATNWLLWIFIVLLFNTIVYSFSVVTLYLDVDIGAIEVVWLINSTLIYIFGHIGIYKFNILAERKKIRTYSIKESSEVKTHSKKNADLLQKKLIEEKQFLDSRLTLESLAKDIGVSTSYLSRIFNTELDHSFSDYVNQLRVDQAKKYLSNAKFSKYTLVAIGLEAGFNSKTTFNTAFKKNTGITPSQYRKKSQM